MLPWGLNKPQTIDPPVVLGLGVAKGDKLNILREKFVYNPNYSSPSHMFVVVLALM